MNVALESAWNSLTLVIAKVKMQPDDDSDTETPAAVNKLSLTGLLYIICNWAIVNPH